jgi:hypothetical protein
MPMARRLPPKATGCPPCCLRPRSFKHVKKSEVLQMLRNQATIIDEVEELSSSGAHEAQEQVMYVHVLVPCKVGGPSAPTAACWVHARERSGSRAPQQP